MRLGKVEIEVVDGSIVELDVDVIVVFACMGVAMTKLYARALSRG